MVDRRRTSPEAPIAQLIGGISNDHVEFHVEGLLRLVCVNKFVGMALQFAAPLVVLLIGPAKTTAPVLPEVFHPFETDVAAGIVEGFTDGVFPVGALGAVEGTARKKGGHLCDSQPEELAFEDVVHPLLPVGDLFLKPLVETLSDLP